MVEIRALLLSVVLFIGCVSLIQAAGLASGTDKGKLVDYLWYPGRTDGVVNQASWDIVPENKWIQVADTELDDLESQVQAVMPGWRDPSSNKWGGVTEAWNGVAYDEAGHRAWWISSGGHGNGANNGIYRFEAFKMKYFIEHMPSDTRQWSYNYTNLKNTITYSSCTESYNVQLEKEANGTLQQENDWYRDQLFWDQQPTSRHVYSGVVYVHERNELVLAVGRLWRYSLAEGKWFYKVIPSGLTDYASLPLGEEVIAHYDQVHDQIITISCGSPGPYSNTFNMSNNKWLDQQVPGGGWALGGGADYRHNNTLTIFRGLEPRNGAPDNNYWSGYYITYDVTNRSYPVYGKAQYSDPNINPEDYLLTDGNGIVYIPPLKAYWVVQTRRSDMKFVWFQMDTTTKPFWTLSFLNFDNPSPTLQSELVRRRMVWLPNLNAVMWLGTADKNISIYKVGPYIPVPPTTTTGTKYPTTSTTGPAPGSSTTGTTSPSTPKPTAKPSTTGTPTTNNATTTGTPKPTTPPTTTPPTTTPPTTTPTTNNTTTAGTPIPTNSPSDNGEESNSAATNAVRVVLVIIGLVVAISF